MSVMLPRMLAGLSCKSRSEASLRSGQFLDKQSWDSRGGHLALDLHLQETVYKPSFVFQENAITIILEFLAVMSTSATSCHKLLTGDFQYAWVIACFFYTLLAHIICSFIVSFHGARHDCKHILDKHSSAYRATVSLEAGEASLKFCFLAMSFFYPLKSQPGQCFLVCDRCDLESTPGRTRNQPKW